MRWIGRLLRRLGLLVLLLVCAALFYILVIMGDTPGEKVSTPAPTVAPLAAMPQPELSVTSIDQAMYYFNAPLMTLEDGAHWRLEGVFVRETQPEGAGGAVREVRLRYIGADGASVDVSSLTPSRYLRALPARGFAPASDQSWTLAGRAAVLMTSGSTLHLHLQNGETVYQIEGDVSADALRSAAEAAKVWE